MADGQALRITGRLFAALFELFDLLSWEAESSSTSETDFTTLFGGWVEDYLVLLWFVMFYCEVDFSVFRALICVFNQCYSMRSNLTGTGSGCFGLLLMQQETGRKQYTDEAYAWEVATVGVCFHVLFSSFAMPVFVFHQSTTR